MRWLWWGDNVTSAALTVGMLPCVTLLYTCSAGVPREPHTCLETSLFSSDDMSRNVVTFVLKKIDVPLLYFLHFFWMTCKSVNATLSRHPWITAWIKGVDSGVASTRATSSTAWPSSAWKLQNNLGFQRFPPKSADTWGNNISFDESSHFARAAPRFYTCACDNIFVISVENHVHCLFENFVARA